MGLSTPPLSGMPGASPLILAQVGVPLVNPGSGSVAANGALTLTTAIRKAYAGCYMALPAGAAYAGSVAGLYWVVMSSTTVGTIYNNLCPFPLVTLNDAGVLCPPVPSSPTPIVAAGPGAFAANTATDNWMLAIKLPGGSIGPNGSIRWRQKTTFHTGTGDSFSFRIGVLGAGTAVFAIPAAGVASYGVDHNITCQGSTSIQVAAPSATYQDEGQQSGGVQDLALNLAVDQYLQLSLYVGATTESAVIEDATIELRAA